MNVIRSCAWVAILLLLCACTQQGLQESTTVLVQGKPFEGQLSGSGEMVKVEMRPMLHMLGLSSYSMQDGKLRIGDSLVPVHDPDPTPMVFLQELSQAVKGELEVSSDGKQINLLLAPHPFDAPIELGPNTEAIVEVEQAEPGQLFDLEKYLKPDRLNIVYFHADWCPSCHQLGPRLASIVSHRDDYQLIKVDFRDFESPIAKQFNISAAPSYLIIQGKKDMVASDSQASVMVTEWMVQAAREARKNAKATPDKE